MLKLRFGFACAVVAICTACGDEKPAPVVRARPVTVSALTESTPSLINRVTGVATPYQQTDFSFEVTGKLAFVVDVGTDVSGKEVQADGALLLAADGTPVQAGDVIATLDTSRYEQALRATELKLASARLAMRAQEVELESMSSADVSSARAQAAAAEVDIKTAQSAVSAAQSAYDLTVSELRRNERLVQSGAVARSKVEQLRNESAAAKSQLEQVKNSVSQKRAARDSALAVLRKSQGGSLLKQSQIEQTKAEIAELDLKLEQAQTDLDDCVLRAPFTGRITAVMLGRGALVKPGTAVATLTLLNPMQISVSVSSADDRRLLLGASVRVAPVVPPAGFGADESLAGAVFQKSQVADPDTSTFKVGLIVPNREISPNPPTEDWAHSQKGTTSSGLRFQDISILA